MLKEAHMHATLTKNCHHIQTIDTEFAGLVPLFQQFLDQANILRSFDSALLTTPHATPPEATSTSSNSLQNLTSLYCRSPSKETSTHIVKNAYLKRVFAFVQTHPRLQVLELEHFKFTDENVHLLTNLIQHHPGLRRVRLESFQQVPLRMYLQLLWNAALHLESFEIACSPCDDNDHFPMVVNDQRLDRTFRIQKLDLGQCRVAMLGGGGGGGPQTLTALLQHCTSLRSLTLPNISSAPELRELSAMICIVLGDLRHLDARALRVSDKVLSELVDACAGRSGTGFSNSGIMTETWSDPHNMPWARAGLESFFALGKNSVGWATVDALRAHHTGTLTHLRLEFCSTMTGAMIQSPLCSCFALQRFEMMGMKDYDAGREPYLSEGDITSTMGPPKPQTHSFMKSIIQSSSRTRSERIMGVFDDKEKDEEDEEAKKKCAWVCLGLQVLSIRMARTQSEILPLVLCDQLGRLSELRHVTIGSNWSTESVFWDAGADSTIYATFCRLGL